MIYYHKEISGPHGAIKDWKTTPLRMHQDGVAFLNSMRPARNSVQL